MPTQPRRADDITRLERLDWVWFLIAGRRQMIPCRMPTLMVIPALELTSDAIQCFSETTTKAFTLVLQRLDGPLDLGLQVAQTQSAASSAVGTQAVKG